MQDVFCGPETIVHVKRGGGALDAEALERALVELEIECSGVARDDGALL